MNLFHKDQMHPESFLCVGDAAVAPAGRSSHLTSGLRRAGEEREQGRQQADSRSHLPAGFTMTKTHQNGSPRRICSVAPALFPLRELTGHITGAKNIRREWGRTRAGVGLRGGARGRPSFASAVLNHRSPFRDSPCVFWTSRVSSFRIHYTPQNRHELAAAVAVMRQSELGASDAHDRASGEPVGGALVPAAGRALHRSNPICRSVNGTVGGVGVDMRQSLFCPPSPPSSPPPAEVSVSSRRRALPTCVLAAWTAEGPAASSVCVLSHTLEDSQCCSSVRLRLRLVVTDPSTAAVHADGASDQSGGQPGGGGLHRGQSGVGE